MRRGWLVGLVAVALLGAACGDDDDGDAAPSSGPVTIEVQIDFTPDLAEGPFEVTEGADVLGCTDGTSVDVENDDPVRGGITKVFTCESGSSVGTFSLLFFPESDPTGAVDESGPWTGTTGTEDFAGLQGEGVMSLTLDSDTSGVVTFTGTVESGP